MDRKEIRKLKAEMKKSSKAQTAKLRKIAEGTVEKPPQEKIEKQTAYVIEMRQNIVPARYPEASWLRDHEDPQPLWMPRWKLLRKFGIEEDGLLYGIAFDEVMCLYKPKINPFNDDTGSRVLPRRREDPVDAVWPSLLNTRKINEQCIDTVKKAELIAMAQLSMHRVKEIYQVGRILYLDYETRKDMEGDAETDRMLFCHSDGRTESFCRIGDDVFYCTGDENCTAGKEAFAMKYEDLKEINEPYRIAQWYSLFMRFEVKSEREWLALFMQVNEKK